MHVAVETGFEILPFVEADNRPDKTYVMKGQYSEKSLETYHLILAPSFACNLRCK